MKPKMNGTNQQEHLKYFSLEKKQIHKYLKIPWPGGQLHSLPENIKYIFILIKDKSRITIKST